MLHRPVLAGLAGLALASCQGSADANTAFVTDVWGRPVRDASVVVEGHFERLHTDARGRAELPERDPLTPMIVRVGRKGFIPVDRTLTSDDLPRFELLPQPEVPGLHVVGDGELMSLPGEPVVAVGNPLRSIRGIRSVGKVTVGDPTPTIVFHTPLRRDELLQLGLELRRLSFVPTMPLPGPLGATEVTVNLHVDGGRVPVTVTPLRERSDYLVRPDAPLEPGHYAFQTQGLLSARDSVLFDRLPPELRMVYAFEVR
ncbi:MAG: hypothetical protein AAF602_23615 [Myxococcota bacterium]